MELNRKRNATRGTLSGIILKIIQVLFSFITRTIFIRTIGIQYLGLNSLFSAILQVLNLAELGVSSALVFSMYRPIAEEDDEKICQLMRLYRIYYRVIGIVVLAIGLALLPFLKFSIKGPIPSDINIYILYAMHLSATVFSYWLFAYRNSILQAYQRGDIINAISIVICLVIYTLRVLVLVIFKNYYFYLLVHIIGQIATNIFTAIISRRLYPQYEPRGILPSEERRIINKKVRDLFTSKVGGVINNSVDSIVISFFLGIELLAVYQNYYYVLSSLMAIFSIFFSASMAGIGNSLVTRSENENRKLLYKINHIVFMGICVCCSCMICLYQPFMRKWTSSHYMLDFSFVILFAIYLFAEEVPRPLLIFKDAGGIWRQDRFRPLTAALINLCLNLTLTPIIGLYGIILSTIFALLGVSFPWVILNIDKWMFPINIKYYLKRTFLYTAAVVSIAASMYAVCMNVNFNNEVWTVCVRFIICFPLSIVLFNLVFWKTDENKYFIDNINGYLRKMRIYKDG